VHIVVIEIVKLITPKYETC